MRNNSIIKLLCSIPVILVVLYFIPFLGVCLLICRYIVYYYDRKRISTPYYLVSIGFIRRTRRGRILTDRGKLFYWNNIKS